MRPNARDSKSPRTKSSHIAPGGALGVRLKTLVEIMSPSTTGTMEKRRAQRLAGAADPQALLRRRQDDALGFFPLDFGELDRLGDPDLGVEPDQSVHADHVNPFVRGMGGQSHGRGETLPLHLDDVPLLDAQRFEVLGAEPDDPLPDVLLDRFRHPDAQRFRCHESAPMEVYTRPRPVDEAA